MKPRPHPGENADLSPYFFPIQQNFIKVHPIAAVRPGKIGFPFPWDKRMGKFSSADPRSEYFMIFPDPEDSGVFTHLFEIQIIPSCTQAPFSRRAIGVFLWFGFSLGLCEPSSLFELRARRGKSLVT